MSDSIDYPKSETEAAAGETEPVVRSRGISKLLGVFLEETAGYQPRLVILRGLLFFIPDGAFSRVRTAFYRLFGFRIGAGSLILGKIRFSGGGAVWNKLRIGSACVINTPLHLELGAEVQIGDGVSIGHDTVMITTSHEVGPASRRCSAPISSPITIGDGAWIAACVTILPGVSVGTGSIVSAGSVVGVDVPDQKIVAGVPARQIKTLAE